MSSTGLWPWPDPTNHEIQMLSTKCRELEAANKAQAEKIERLQAALKDWRFEAARALEDEQMDPTLYATAVYHDTIQRIDSILNPEEGTDV